MSGLYAFRSGIGSSSSTSTSTKAPARPGEPLPCPPAGHHLHLHHRSSQPPAPRLVPAGVYNTSSTALRNALPAAAAPQASTVQPIKPKQVVDLQPVSETVRARFYGTSTLNYSSSGSNHDPSSHCLAAMVNEFLEEEVRVGKCGRARCNCLDGACGDETGDSVSVTNEADEAPLVDEHLSEILEGITACASNTELLLLLDVAKAMEEVAEQLTPEIRTEDKEAPDAMISRFRRPVMKHLQQAGYNAAMCKSRWSHADGLPAGDYDYIDVIVEGQHGKQERFIVDIDFRAQFEIARASDQYFQLLSVLPRLFVGKGERLKQILKIMSNAAKRSLREQGLHLPPWRKLRYMQAKWFSSYRRTTNPEETASRSISSSSSSSAKNDQCGMLGFNIGMRAPRISSAFTKEMDMAYYRAQTKGLQQNPRVFVTDDTRDKLGRGVAYALYNNFVAPREVRTTGLCTDWQLPPLNRKHDRKRDMISGLANALKESTLQFDMISEADAHSSAAETQKSLQAVLSGN